MNPGDVIFEQGIYQIKFVETLGVPNKVHVNGEVKNANGHKGFNFVLFKDDQKFKQYAIATGYPYNYEAMKSQAIQILSKYAV